MFECRVNQIPDPERTGTDFGPGNDWNGFRTITGKTTGRTGRNTHYYGYRGIEYEPMSSKITLLVRGKDVENADNVKRLIVRMKLPSGTLVGEVGQVRDSATSTQANQSAGLELVSCIPMKVLVPVDCTLTIVVNINPWIGSESDSSPSEKSL